MDIYDLISIRVCILFHVRDWNQYSFHLHYLPAVEIALSSSFAIYTAQQKFSMDFIFVLILERIRNDFFEVINKYGNP